MEGGEACASKISREGTFKNIRSEILIHITELFVMINNFSAILSPSYNSCAHWKQHLKQIQ